MDHAGEYPLAAEMSGRRGNCDPAYNSLAERQSPESPFSAANRCYLSCSSTSWTSSGRASPSRPLPSCCTSPRTDLSKYALTFQFAYRNAARTAHILLRPHPASRRVCATMSVRCRADLQAPTRRSHPIRRAGPVHALPAADCVAQAQRLLHSCDRRHCLGKASATDPPAVRAAQAPGAVAARGQGSVNQGDEDCGSWGGGDGGGISTTSCQPTV